MRTFTRSLLARLTVALAIAIAVLAAPAGSSAFHDAVVAGHVTMVDRDERGHSHDIVDRSDETGSSASHGGDHHKHNPGDHSHEKLGTPPALATLSAAGANSRLIASRDPKVRGLTSSFLRPPRPSDIA